MWSEKPQQGFPARRSPVPFAALVSRSIYQALGPEWSKSCPCGAAAVTQAAGPGAGCFLVTRGPGCTWLRRVRAAGQSQLHPTGVPPTPAIPVNRGCACRHLLCQTLWELPLSPHPPSDLSMLQTSGGWPSSFQN